MAFVELFRKSSGRSSGGVLRMLFAERGGVMSATSAKDRRAKMTKILGYDPYKPKFTVSASSSSIQPTLSTSAVQHRAELDIADMLEGMRQMMTSQIKRACFMSWKQVRWDDGVWMCVCACVSVRVGARGRGERGVVDVVALRVWFLRLLADSTPASSAPSPPTGHSAKEERLRRRPCGAAAGGT